MLELEIIKFAEEAGRKLLASKQMLVTAESCTGGGVAYAITSIAGSSAWFDRGLVTYSNIAKEELLNVSSATLITEGAVSKQTAIEMALGALENNYATVSLSITGIAGPGGGTPSKPVGTVWFAWANKIMLSNQASTIKNQIAFQKKGEGFNQVSLQQLENKPIYLVSVQHNLIKGDRVEIRKRAIIFALQGLLKHLP
ncbi:MAG: hypothetical protein A3E87_00610 [Gammaproteobacteria bacterium RIFCSPHIGHO2_12_FULL_35_23]|nr:MAG: hypothetical protein A3E87_00610 [Gammaproteobacteria bacterium RIFCSPHIGHO2_12_FULL_35_23]